MTPNDERDKAEDPKTRGKKRFFKWSLDDVVYNQRLFFALWLLAIAAVVSNPWVLYEAQRDDREREIRQTDQLIENSNENKDGITQAIEKLDRVVQQVNRGQFNAAIRFNESQGDFDRLLQHIDQSVIGINRTVVEQASREANLTQAETEELIDQLQLLPQTLRDILTTQANRTLQQDNNNKISQALEILRNQSNIGKTNQSQ